MSWLLTIVPTLCVVMHPVTLRVTRERQDAERPMRHSHAERGNDHPGSTYPKVCLRNRVVAKYV
ncbi:hypothetical protein FJ692_04505 [Pseudomonas fluorescens]|nr:hypothetical protein C1751_04755 [Pseudomonas fluorescens]PRW80352.1 hypothetical protein C7A12_03995 [Pseudomonas fluorescens]PRW81588.1 hypothetical protein C7A13_05120 [Pseudomonas fluorescens]TPV60409.1 hypothetical protein FJ692_04505 [Pseudomonas fluorescens]